MIDQVVNVLLLPDPSAGPKPVSVPKKFSYVKGFLAILDHHQNFVKSPSYSSKT